MELTLSNLRIGFACKERWADMVGDDRVRACAGCNRSVFNLSAMAREQAEAVLASRGLTPCVRFYRRPDGTVMTTDCPTGARREGRRLAVVASTLAGTALATSPAMADPPPAAVAPASDDAAATPDPVGDSAGSGTAPEDAAGAQGVVISTDIIMGIPIPEREPEMEMGVLIETREADRPVLEWSTWARLGYGIASQSPSVVARSFHPPMAESGTTWEAAVAADLTLPLARHGDVRFGAWGEVRTTSGPVVGGEILVEGLPPHPNGTMFDGGGGIVLRAGGNGHVVTGALGFGYVGSWPRNDPWISWARHMVGVRVVASMNRSLDDPHDWSATFGLELEPIGALSYVLGFH